jgi:hypothetical protein
VNYLPGLASITILLISAFWIARIIGVSYRCPASNFLKTITSAPNTPITWTLCLLPPYKDDKYFRRFQADFLGVWPRTYLSWYPSAPRTAHTIRQTRFPLSLGPCLFGW